MWFDLAVGSEFELKLRKGESARKESLRAKAAHLIAHEHISYLEEDLWARRILGASLGATVWRHERVLSQIGGMPGATEILFHLSLPSLAHIPIRDLIAVRAAEGASFTTFRSELIKAAQEMVSNRIISNPRTAAAEIIREVVVPELARLKQRLRAAQRALARKTAVSVTLAGLSITCGLLLGGGTVVAGVAGVDTLISGVATTAFKYLDEKQSIELSDVYFLWKALGHAN